MFAYLAGQHLGTRQVILIAYIAAVVGGSQHVGLLQLVTNASILILLLIVLSGLLVFLLSILLPVLLF